MFEAALGAPLENPDREMCLQAGHGWLYLPLERARREDSRACGRSSKSREEAPARGWASSPAWAKTLVEGTTVATLRQMQGRRTETPYSASNLHDPHFRRMLLLGTKRWQGELSLPRWIVTNL